MIYRSSYRPFCSIDFCADFWLDSMPVLCWIRRVMSLSWPFWSWSTEQPEVNQTTENMSMALFWVYRFDHLYVATVTQSNKDGLQEYIWACIYSCPSVRLINLCKLTNFEVLDYSYQNTTLVLPSYKNFKIYDATADLFKRNIWMAFSYATSHLIQSGRGIQEPIKN